MARVLRVRRVVRLLLVTLAKVVAVWLLVGLIVLVLQAWPGGAWASAIGLGVLIYGVAWALTPAWRHWRAHESAGR